MKLSERQEKVLDLARHYHSGQVRKYTGEPYINHPIAVAEMVAHLNPSDFFVEMALCHDLLEDTTCTDLDLMRQLIDVGYSGRSAKFIVEGVIGLTDQYTTENYSYLNREMRKNKESIRLSRESAEVQTVKYADLIDNTCSIVEHDYNFAAVYLEEKRRLLQIMDGGDLSMRNKCIESLNESIRKHENKGNIRNSGPMA